MKQLLSSQLLPGGRQQQRQQHLLLQSLHPPRPPGNRLPSATPKLWEKTKIRRCSFLSSGCYGAAFQAPMIFSPLLFSRLPFCLLAAGVAFFSAFVVFMFRGCCLFGRWYLMKGDCCCWKTMVVKTQFLFLLLCLLLQAAVVGNSSRRMGLTMKLQTKCFERSRGRQCVPKAQQHAEEFKEAGQHIIFKGEGEEDKEVDKAAHRSSRPTTTRSLLCLSNGHGEDTIAASILMALLVGIH